MSSILIFMKIFTISIISLIALGLISIMIHGFLFGPGIEDPFNSDGRNIYKNYYLYYFREGEMFVIWRKYREILPEELPPQAISLMMHHHNQLILCIDHQWYELDMDTDQVREIPSPVSTESMILPEDFYEQL